MREDFTFVRMCILSVRNEFQLECCQELIELFVKKHTYDSGLMDDFFSLTDELKKKGDDFEPMPRIVEGL